MICRSPVTVDSFAKLKIIKVKGCKSLKNLFSFYADKFLATLETIDVSECNSLKEIVEITPEKVEFLKLHSLTLQSLSSFTSFYNRIAERDDKEITVAQNEHSDMAPPLFGELIEIPNLESLNLSSVGIHKIWSDEPLSSFWFQNLVKLVVENCANLRYLCSLSVASGLKKLKVLFISGCSLMEKIFETEGNSTYKVDVFPKLEEIHLSKMEMLTDIWHAETCAHSFSSVISVDINGCKKLDKIFPSHMEGWFASLNSLKVNDCESVEVIFEIRDSQKVDTSAGEDTNLQLILVSGLPNLKRVWSRDPGGILNFKKLHSVEVSFCHELMNVFPASVAKDIQKLENMSVTWCEQMVEIVACKDGSETNNEPLVFPELTYIQLENLANMKHFYKGRHTIECTKLKRLEVTRCKKLQIFPTEKSQSTNEESPLFSAVVIPNLERMEINFEEAQDWYQMHRLKELSLTMRAVKSADLLCQFLYRMPNLEKLSISCLGGSELEELVPSADIAPRERLGTVLQLKKLVVSWSKIKDLGFEREPVLQSLELLRLYKCHELTNLAPPSVTLAYLTNLQVYYCDGLRNLMTSSTAKSLVQLKSIKVRGCSKVEHIVSNERNEEDRVMEIVFSKLITIELVGLQNLKSFCSYKNCEFKFPSLEILIVRYCPMMKTFTQSLTSAPKLQNIFGDKGEEEAKWQWEGDLNAIIQKDFNDQISESASDISKLKLRDSPLQGIWLGSLSIPDSCFSHLQSLIVEDCQFLKDAVLPFNLLPLLVTLETLQVRRCNSVKTIFDVKRPTQDREMTTMGINDNAKPLELKKLILEGLPNLENVCNADPKGTNLELTFRQVKSLTLCDLPNLENVCNADPKGTNLERTFPQVKSLTLCDLPKLNPVSIEKLPPKIELTLGENELKMILRGEFQGNHLQKLKVRALLFHVDSHVFLQQVPNLGKLVVCDGSFKEDFSFRSPNVDKDGLLSQLKVLCLDSLPELVSIGLHNSCIVPFLKNLKTLKVMSCFSSINLVPCSVSLSNLTILEARGCKSLLYLFTSSTAKSLAKLKTMNIINCGSIGEVVSKEVDESQVDEIVFPQLNCLKLKNLPKLRSFYKGSLSFPSLKKLSVMRCDNMETFCTATVKTDKLLLKEVILEYKFKEKPIPLETDLNSFMQSH